MTLSIVLLNTFKFAWFKSLKNVVLIFRKSMKIPEKNVLHSARSFIFYIQNLGDLMIKKNKSCGKKSKYLFDFVVVR